MIFRRANLILQARLPAEFEAQRHKIDQDIPVIYMERKTCVLEEEPVNLYNPFDEAVSTSTNSL